MVWFARLRPKFSKVVACTMIISALASAGSTIRELKAFDGAKAAYSEILGLEQVENRTEKEIIKAREILLDAVSIKTHAEKLAKEGKIRESREIYGELLKRYEKVIEILTIPDKQGNHIALAKNDIVIIKRKLKDNKFFDPNRVDIRALEQNIYNAWMEVDRLTKDVSAEVQSIERILGITN